MENFQSTSLKSSVNDSIDPLSGLTIDDLNKYLPALQTLKDLEFTSENLKEGLFGQTGLKDCKGS